MLFDIKRPENSAEKPGAGLSENINLFEVYI